MRAFLFLFAIAITLGGCSSVKRNQQFIASGNYDQAIQLAVKKLQKGKDAEKFQEHIVLLEEAYRKAVSEDLRRIGFLQKSNEPNASRQLYHLYVNLEERQLSIRPLLPLYSTILDRNAVFKFADYSDEIIAAKARYVNDLYAEALRLKNRNQTDAFRQAYYLFCDVAELQPNYKDVENQLQETRFAGTTFVLVRLTNQSGQIIPVRLERELLDFNTYGLDDFWTEYHSNREQGIRYDLGIDLLFRDIAISPERISEKEFIREKQVKDGWRYKKDRRGNYILDAKGNKIKEDTYITVTARVIYTQQEKAVRVGGDVLYRDLQRNQNRDRHPLATEFIFENTFATFRGDERALTDEDLEFIENRAIPFPSNAQMVLDAGAELKNQLKHILNDSPALP
ncbi:MAG: hypothetical protein CMC08_00505 [Flavobacteriaceae bacterium]|nr:hypothetical protein [Flavobacteriaceae bacterium]